MRALVQLNLKTALGLCAVGGAVMLGAFNNCARFKTADLSSLGLVAGADYCRAHAGDTACAAAAAPTCAFNGKTLTEGARVTAYLMSTVPAGAACATEERRCAAGVLSGSYAFASCTPAAASGLPPAAACLFNGRTIASGTTVTAYRLSTETSCAPETRACTNGVLNGSFAFASCDPVAPAACLFNGQTIPHGQSVTAYATSSVPAGGACAASVRTCFNGALSGAGEFAVCTPARPAACLFNGQSIPDGGSVTAFATSSVAAGAACAATSRVCSNGTLGGAGDFATCTPAQAASCLVNGQTIASGSAAPFYVASTPNLDGLCPVELRTCSNGASSGSAAATSCVLPSPDDGARVLVHLLGADSQHMIGAAGPNGSWVVFPGDGPGFMAYGPYVTTLPAAASLARFSLTIDNVTLDNQPVATLDVADATTHQALVTRVIRRQDFQKAGVAQNFSVDFAPPAGHSIEFRVNAAGRATLVLNATNIRAEGLQRDMLLWVDSGIDDAEYVGVHAEARTCDSPDYTCGPWTSVTQVMQPFKSRWDNTRYKMYWWKDMLGYDFNGEIWNLTSAGLEIRQESLAYYPGFDDPGPTPDDWVKSNWILPDRFRLFSLAARGDLNPGVNPWPKAAGRLLSPRMLDWDWSTTQTINTFRCYSWAQFAQGQCPLLQAGVQDSRVSVGVIDDFSSDFDGPNDSDQGKWQPVPEFRSFERAVVINQEMAGIARERFFFAERAGRYYGIVRWDNSVYDAARGRWQVVQRTLGVQRKNDHRVDFTGMVQRGLHD